MEATRKSLKEEEKLLMVEHLECGQKNKNQRIEKNHLRDRNIVGTYKRQKRSPFQLSAVL